MSLFDTVKTGSKLFRNGFHLPCEKTFDAKFGEAVPVMARFALPGDTWSIDVSAFIRTIPMFSPSLTPISVRFRTFAIPLHTLQDDAVKILTGFHEVDSPSGKHSREEYNGTFVSASGTPKKYGFWDYLGCQVGLDFSKCGENVPAKYWLKGYKKLFNWWYRDEVTQGEIDIDDDSDDLWKVNYQRDYFTSSLLELQLGNPTAIPVGAGVGNNVLRYLDEIYFKGQQPGGYYDHLNSRQPAGTPVYLAYTTTANYSSGTPVGQSYNLQFVPVMRGDPPNGGSPNAHKYSALSGRDGLDLVGGENDNYVRLGVGSDNLSLGQFTINSWREALALQGIHERANRVGIRYTEFLLGTFGVAPTDETLQEPVYLGGSVAPIVVSEVVQTSATQSNSPQGNLAGKGMSLTSQKLKHYFVKEHSLIMTIMSITPDTSYVAQGVPREFTYRSHYDFFDPSLQTIGERAVRNGELYVADDGKNDDTFGYQPYGEELRHGQKFICGEFRDTLAYWHLGRKFATRPNLNSSFVEVDAQRDNLNRNFVVTDGAPFYVHSYVDCKVTRPMLKHAIPFTI